MKNSTRTKLGGRANLGLGRPTGALPGRRAHPSAWARTAWQPPGRTLFALLWLTSLLLSSAGCEDDGQVLENATITVGCASCIFEMEGALGCPFAAEIDGKHYMIQGRVPEGHESHAPDGICNMRRKAKVDGRLRDGKLITTRVELLPAAQVPDSPRFTPADVHNDTE